MPGKKKTPKKANSDVKSTAIATRKKKEAQEAADKEQFFDLKEQIHKLSDNFVTVVIDLQIIKEKRLWHTKLMDKEM